MLKATVKKEKCRIEIKNNCNIKTLKRLYYAGNEKRGLISIINHFKALMGALLFLKLE